jgi:hypothetical protein
MSGGDWIKLVVAVPFAAMVWVLDRMGRAYIAACAQVEAGDDLMAVADAVAEDECSCQECQEGPATLDKPHTDINVCRCLWCVTARELVRCIRDDQAWDRAVITELGSLS